MSEANNFTTNEVSNFTNSLGQIMILSGRLIENEQGELIKNPAYEGVGEGETLPGYYAIERIQPYDMFPQTKHVETIVCLCKQ